MVAKIMLTEVFFMFWNGQDNPAKRIQVVPTIVSTDK
jgi:hypothetical protein